MGYISRYQHLKSIENTNHFQERCERLFISTSTINDYIVFHFFNNDFKQLEDHLTSQIFKLFTILE